MRLRYLLFPLLLAGGLNARAQALLQKLGSISLPTIGTALAVDGTTAYVLTASAGESQLLTYDVSTPASPRQLSRLALPTANTPPLPFRYAVVSNHTLYVSSYPTSYTTPHSESTLALNVQNPSAPALIGHVLSVGGDETHLAASGDYLYTVSDNGLILRVYNRTGPIYSSYLSEVKNINLPYSLSGILSLCASGNTLYVQYGNGVFATVDITNPAAPVSSSATRVGTISAASGALAVGLAQPQYVGSVPSNTLRIYSLATLLQPALIRELPGSYGTRVALQGQFAYTVGETSPYIPAVASSREPLRAYYLPASGGAPIVATDPASQGANALVAANNLVYAVTDTDVSIYAFPATALATRAATATANLPLYPNPARGQVHLPQLAPGSPVSIFDVTGRCCLQAAVPAQGHLDISSLSAGLYHVRAGGTSSKLVVE
ncbi:T9SS type A sorting domain-containing protein [Hymenobacter sp. RP-2-7]|uniref:T9SS type A sorting domain-containing protein n=1 Tax=Hymenobacter polaris TaxID=2682546 RepID=A0A7Y0ABI4_9BACT|nr:T9SS type A sorting domain-containing protein [Hymenobacter polaris]NML64344.1 T9SS type A sorting domain-containing protein [Hymenobacter polaris]